MSGWYYVFIGKIIVPIGDKVNQMIKVMGLNEWIMKSFENLHFLLFGFVIGAMTMGILATSIIYVGNYEEINFCSVENERWPASFFSLFLAVCLLFFRKYPEVWSFIQPILDLTTTYQLYLFRFQKDQHENDLNYPYLCVIGWNILKRAPGELKYTLSLPTEVTIHIEKIFLEATALQDIAAETVMKPIDPNRPEPDFFLVVPSEKHHEFHRLISNALSNSVGSSLWSA